MHIRLFAYQTNAGVFSVRLVRDRWRAMFEEEDLGAYLDPRQAAYEIANGHTFWPSCGDPSKLGISEELEDWTPAR